MKILSNKTYYDYQTELAEKKIQINALQKEKRDLMKENDLLKSKNFNLQQEADSLRHSLEMANEVIAKTGVVRGKDGKLKSTKKKEK